MTADCWTLRSSAGATRSMKEGRSGTRTYRASHSERNAVVGPGLAHECAGSNDLSGGRVLDQRPIGGVAMRVVWMEAFQHELAVGFDGLLSGAEHLGDGGRDASSIVERGPAQDQIATKVAAIGRIVQWNGARRDGHGGILLRQSAR